MSTVDPLRRNRLKPVPDVAAGDPLLQLERPESET